MTKIALITGGSRGLGKAGALAMAQTGIGVVITYQKNAEAAQEVVQTIENAGGSALALALDMAQPESFEAFVSAFSEALERKWQRSHFDFLVNNAGMGAHVSLAETTEAQFDALMQVHFKGPFFLTQKLLPLLNDGGRILNISTGLTRFSFPGYGAYAAMKGAVEVWTRYLAKELGPRGISANTLAPGAIATDFSGGAVRDNEQLQQMLAAQTGLGRVGQAEDIGPVMAALVDPRNTWINGQRIEASGGMLL